LPPILIIDIQFFDEEGEIIKKNFTIPSKLNMGNNYWDNRHNLNDPTKYFECPNYELFATIAFDAKKLENMAYYPLIKKYHKNENKAQWYVFQEGEYFKIKRS
jgi:hypothetical protein